MENCGAHCAGDSLAITLDVAAAKRTQTRLVISKLSNRIPWLDPLGAGSPVLSPARGAGEQTTNGTCVQNFECSVTNANTQPGQATVGLVVGNLYQCTGTLINDVPGDNTPYVLTARHCESGTYGGGNPGAAETVTVYWNAVSSCGETLGSIYDPSVATQTGATTVVEQQDIWLIRLDMSPVVANAQMAGFDASGATVQGGYSIHHALGLDKQLAQWTGPALPATQAGALGAGYTSNLLEVVNQLGNIGAGSAGAGLFDQNNRLVGALSFGRSR